MKKILLTATLALAISAQAETKWNMATPYSEAVFHTQNIQQFAKDVAEKTGGEVNITVHSGHHCTKHRKFSKPCVAGKSN